MKKKLMMILIFLLSVLLAQDAFAYFSDMDLTHPYGTGHSGVGDWTFGSIGNHDGPWDNDWFGHGRWNPVDGFREVVNGKFLVTEEQSREFSFDFSSLLGLSFKKAVLSFSVSGPKKGSEEVTLWADGEEIFSTTLSQSQKNYQIDLLKVDPASLQDGKLTLTFLAPEGDYSICRLALNITAQGPATTPVPIPAGLWLFGSGLGTLLIGRIKKQ